jgi:hypothetical protein
MITDDDGLGSSLFKQVNVTGVQNRPPVITGSIPEGSTVTAEVEEKVAFSVNVVDADGDPLTYIWSVDGSIVAANGSSYSFVPNRPGEHTVMVNVSDGVNAPVLREWTVSVSKPDKPVGPEPTYTLLMAVLAVVIVTVVVIMILILFLKMRGKEPPEPSPEEKAEEGPVEKGPPSASDIEEVEQAPDADLDQRPMPEQEEMVRTDEDPGTDVEL